MKLRIIILCLCAYFVPVQAQNYEKDWDVFEKRMHNTEYLPVKEFEAFENKYQKVFEQHPDNSVDFYARYAFSLLNEKDEKNAVEGLKWSYHYATKAKDTTLKHIAVYHFGLFYNQTENYAEAEKYYAACLAPLAAVWGASHPSYSEIYFEYTIVMMKEGKLKEIAPAIDALIYYYKEMKGEKDIHYLILLHNKAAIAQKTGDYKTALDVFGKLANEALYLKSGDTTGYISSISDLADVYRETSRYDQAFFYFKKAREEFFRLKSKDRKQLAVIENCLGLCYKAFGEIKKAEESFETALNIYRETGNTATDDYCVTLNNKGDLYRELGRHGLASEILLQSLEIRKKHLGTATQSYGNTLNNLGLVYLDAAYYDEALKRTLEAKEVYEKTVGKEHQFYGNCLNNLYSIYLHTGDYKKAEEYKTEALLIIEKSVGKNHFRYPTFLISTTPLYFKTRQLSKAEASLKEALQLSERNFGKDHELCARAQLGLAEVYSMSRQFEQAAPYYLSSLNYYTNQLNDYFSAMSEENQFQFLASVEPVFESFNIFLLNYRLSNPGKDLSLYIKRALQNQVLVKSLLGKNAAKLKGQVQASNDPELMKLYLQWVQVKNTLINNSKSAEENIDDNELLKEASALEAKLKTKLGSAMQNKPASFEELKLQLNSGEALVEIFRTNEWLTDSSGSVKYGAIVVHKNSVSPELVIYKNGEQLEGKYFTAFSDAIDNQLNDTASYRVYFKPLKNSLKDIAKIYISPDGVFQKIPMAALRDAATGKYVQDHTDIYNTVNISSVNNSSVAVKKQSAALFGYPDYEYDFNKQASRPGEKGGELLAKRYGLSGLSKLPGTKKEVDDISAALKEKEWKVNVFTDEFASEKNLRQAQSPGILHIATHGYYLKDVETADKMFLGFESNKLRQNSFLRSGIILAGAGPSTSDSLNVLSENDGIVTANEASLLNLSGTELVVLSACQTGLGDNMGSEGVAGLQRSFAIAGAKNIIMSLWPVDDFSTQFLMTEFYKNYAGGKSVEESFKTARAETKKKYEHPYYWAAFVLLKTFN